MPYSVSGVSWHLHSHVHINKNIHNSRVNLGTVRDKEKDCLENPKTIYIHTVMLGIEENYSYFYKIHANYLRSKESQLPTT